MPGFTLIELVMVLLIIGVLAVFVIPRLDLLRGFDEIGYRDKVRGTLEFARKSAVAQRRNVNVNLSGNDLILTVAADVPEGAAGTTYGRALVLPSPDRLCAGQPVNQVCAPDGITLTGPANLQFSPLGRPSAAATYTVGGAVPEVITVEAETGHVR